MLCDGKWLSRRRDNRTQSGTQCNTCAHSLFGTPVRISGRYGVCRDSWGQSRAGDPCVHDDDNEYKASSHYQHHIQVQGMKRMVLHDEPATQLTPPSRSWPRSSDRCSCRVEEQYSRTLDTREPHNDPVVLWNTRLSSSGYPAQTIPFYQLGQQIYGRVLLVSLLDVCFHDVHQLASCQEEPAQSCASFQVGTEDQELLVSPSGKQRFWPSPLVSWPDCEPDHSDDSADRPHCKIAAWDRTVQRTQFHIEGTLLSASCKPYTNYTTNGVGCKPR